MNLHQMKKCEKWVRDYLPKEGEPIQPSSYFSQHLYEFIMPYRRNVQCLKKKMRFQKAEIARLRLSNQGDESK